MVTDFEEQVARWRRLCAMMPKTVAKGPTAHDLVAVALGYDPSQDGIYLCQRCGATHDPECAYGGWHDATQAVAVSVPWMEVA